MYHTYILILASLVLMPINEGSTNYAPYNVGQKTPITIKPVARDYFIPPNMSPATPTLNLQRFILFNEDHSVGSDKIYERQY